MLQHDSVDRQVLALAGAQGARSASSSMVARAADEGVSCRLGDASCASAHAASVSRKAGGCHAAGMHRTLLQLQRDFGNHHVGLVLRQVGHGGHAENGMDAVEPAIGQARGGGQGMDHSTRTRMESSFGVDFSGVRIHTDTRADALSQSLSARAFATGQDVFFRQGEYNPGSSGGRELLAHELTHVVQQTGGIRRKMTVSQPGDPHEVEADQVARAVMQAELAQGAVQRQPEASKEEDEHKHQH